MNTRVVYPLLVAMALAAPVLIGGCEVQHTDTTKDNLLGGQTHDSTTVIKNPDGTTSVDKSETVTH